VFSPASSAPNSIISPKGRGSEQQFLHFFLEPDSEAMLQVAQLTEVLTVPLGQIVPIPHLPAWTMGVYNWRGEILWVVDLGHLLGLTPWHRQVSSRSNYQVIILNGGQEDNRRSSPDRNSLLGLVVSQVKDIETLDTNMIQSIPSASVSSQLVPYLRGFWVDSQNNMFVVLEGRAIIERVKQAKVS